MGGNLDYCIDGIIGAERHLYIYFNFYHSDHFEVAFVSATCRRISVCVLPTVDTGIRFCDLDEFYGMGYE